MHHRLILTATIVALAFPAIALHDKNAGPANVELKFKLPPPKPLTAAEQMKTFKIAPGFKMELFASEPMIECPVAISWDDQGRAYVVEMRGYMHDVSALGEDQPNGVISILEDTDGDGKADKKTVFAEGLIMPRAVMCVNGGALVGEPPGLYFMKDTDGDGKADVKELVDSAYGTRGGQPEHLANSPTWTLDNWIYNANHVTRYRFKDGKFISESMQQRGQWGMTQDNYGRPYYNYNSDFLQANLVPETLYKRNPNWQGGAGAGFKVVKDQSTWPAAPTPGVNRGYDGKSLSAEGKLTAATGSGGAGIYRSEFLGKGFLGNAFVPEPAGNLVKRFILSEKDAIVSGVNSTNGEEFLASTDERFRPVYAYTGPDGALWIADMYRGVIQHKGFLTHYLIANIKDRKLEQPVNMGRIWRVVPEGKTAKTVKLPSEPAKIVPFLDHENGWVRDTAQRLLIEKKDASVAPALAALAKSGNPLGRLHALWTIEGMGTPAPEVVKAAFSDQDSKVRAAAVRIADRSLAPEFAKLVGDPSVDVQIALGFASGSFPESFDTAVALAQKASANELVRDAVMSGLRGRELETLEKLVALKNAPEPMLASLSAAVLNERKSARVKKFLGIIAAQPANSPVQLALLEGAGGKNAPKNQPKSKLLYLDSEAAELAALAKSVNDNAKPLLAALDARIAWPGKPGVPPPPVITPLTPNEQALFNTGKQVYNTLCTACHQPNGQGMDGLAPTLVDSDWVLGKPEVVAKIIIHGLAGPIEVNGQSWTLEMPPLGAALSDEQVAGVTTYIRREWEHNASPISVEAVKQIRTENKDRTKSWTGEELGFNAKKKSAKKK